MKAKRMLASLISAMMIFTLTPQMALGVSDGDALAPSAAAAGSVNTAATTVRQSATTIQEPVAAQPSNGQRSGNTTTTSSEPASAPLIMTAAAVSNENIGSGNITCDKPGILYRISGTSKNNHITVKGGTSSDPVLVDLNGVDIDLHDGHDDGDSIEASPLTVENGYAIIYIGKDSRSKNTLYGGNDTGAFEKNGGYAGISIAYDAHVTISGTGTLYTTGGGVEFGAAGIGGNYNNASNNIVIDGSMTIHAQGGPSAPGIGSGRDGQLSGITINNGTIYANGGSYAPGIGAGEKVGAKDGGKGHNIIINGGNITAKGGKKGAGIGGSNDGDCDNITINGGTVSASGGSGGAGIGGGCDAYMSRITINGGTIRATGGSNAAGIGAGDHVELGNGGDVNGIYIYGGNIAAQGGENGAGIGGSDNGAVDGLRIEQKGALTINATGGKNGAGIGSANAASGSIYIRLNGASITANGGAYGAGIGGGDSDTDKIEIYGNGTVYATGGAESAGIGGGSGSHCGAIIIDGDAGRSMSITAKALDRDGFGINNAAAIGSGNTKSGDINITDAVLNVTADGFGAGIGTGSLNGLVGASINAINIKNCRITANGNNKYAAGIGAGCQSTINYITITDSEYTGATIGGSTTQSHMENYNDIKSIYIENSTITATATSSGDSQCAAIGTGPWGAIEKITIKGSTVTARGSRGGAGIGSGGWPELDSLLERHGGKCGDIIITDSRIDAYAEDGGAAIGGGYETSTGNITLERSTVSAVSEGTAQAGGAGIGGGHACDVGKVYIENCPSVVAKGGSYSAGIGSSGDSGNVTNLWETSAGSFLIVNSTVNATGGQFGAGIGTGMGGCFVGGVTISDSRVTAIGGDNGAGIGGGANGYGGRGADATSVAIKGNSQVDAKGGWGAAGIGGGFDGALGNMTIALTDKSDRSNYVFATGGSGAAGIGSGSVFQSRDHDALTQSGHSGGDIMISGGYVVARGGNDRDYLGNGAGIGGGSRWGTLSSLTVKGGFVEAYCGGGGDGFDIGRGGKGSLKNSKPKDGKILIDGGTVLCGKMSGDSELVIDGGSVRCNRLNAKNSDGINVYRTTLKLAREANTKLYGLSTSFGDYGTTDIYSDGYKKIYLYLPVSQTNGSTADVKLSMDTRHYYGTTTSDGNGLLKMDLTLSMKQLAQPVVGEEFQIALNDAEITGGPAVCTVTGSASLVILNRTDSPGIVATLKANDFGMFYVNMSGAVKDSDLYWNYNASYKGNIIMEKGRIAITEDISKIFDNEPVDDPSVDQNGPGTLTYTYYSGTDTSGAALGSAPKNAGTYTVVAKMAASVHYTAAVSEPKTFTIEKRSISLALTPSENGTDATVTAELLGAVDAAGSIRLVAFNIDTNTTVADVTLPVTYSQGKYAATYTFSGIRANTFKVTATYVPGSPENYTCTNSPLTQTFKKNRAWRTLSVADPGAKQYGDADFSLVCTTDKPLAGDIYDYSVVYSGYPALDPDASVDANGNVSIKNAGMCTIKVVLHDPTDQYDDAVSYVSLNIARIPLTVTSYATDGAQKITSVEYGKISSLQYKLEYSGFIGSDDEKNFTSGHGSLSAVQPNRTLGTSSADYQIGIAKTGNDITIGSKTYRNVFLSRNYAITYVNGKIKVTPAELNVAADSATGEWGTEPAYTYSVKNMEPWDSYEFVFSTEPSASLDKTNTGGKSFDELEPGTYAKAVGVTTGILNNNENGLKNYTVAVNSADLTVTKALAGLSVNARTKIYDGVAAVATAMTSAKYDSSQPVITYYALKSGVKTKIDSAPVNAGIYYATASTAENAHFYGMSSTTRFFILRATPAVNKPVLPDKTMHRGLMLSEQKLPSGWSWYKPTKNLSVGPVQALAIYTPADQLNYHKVYRYLDFNVVQAAVPTPSAAPSASASGSSSDGSVASGDSSQYLIWLVIGAVAVIGAAYAFSEIMKSRKKKNKGK